MTNYYVFLCLSPPHEPTTQPNAGHRSDALPLVYFTSESGVRIPMTFSDPHLSHRQPLFDDVKQSARQTIVVKAFAHDRQSSATAEQQQLQPQHRQHFQSYHQPRPLLDQSPPSAATSIASVRLSLDGGVGGGGGLMTFCCRKCGRGYRTKYTCNRHERNECGIPAKFSCSACGFRAKHKHNLKQHYESVHLGRRMVTAGGGSGDGGSGPLQLDGGSSTHLPC